MRALLLVLALLQAVPASAQLRSWVRVKDSGRRGPLLSMPLTGDCSCSAVSGLTFTRASSATCVTSAGVVVTCSTDQPRTSAAGLFMEELRTNLVLRNSDASNASWTKTNATCTLTATGPDGQANSASTCTATSGNGTVLQGVTAGASTRATSLWLKRRTGTGGVEVTRNNGSTWTAVTSSLTSSWLRFAPSCPSGDAYCVAVPALSSAIANPTVGVRLVTSGDAVDMALVQDEASGGAVSTSAIATAGTSASRSADLATVANPLSGLNPSSWCIGGTLTPEGTWGSVAVARGVVALGTYGAANSAGLYVQATGILRADVIDASSGVKSIDADAALSEGSHRVALGVSSGTLSLYVDGVQVASTASGSGTGSIATQPATARLGSLTSGNYWANGWVAGASIDSSTGGCR